MIQPTKSGKKQGLTRLITTGKPLNILLSSVSDFLFVHLVFEPLNMTSAQTFNFTA